MIKRLYFFIVIILLFIGCSVKQSQEISLNDIVKEDVADITILPISIINEVATLGVYNDTLIIENAYSEKPYRFFSLDGDSIYEFGIDSQNIYEYPNASLLYENDGCWIMNTQIHKIFKINGDFVASEQELNINETINQAKVVRWPFIGGFSDFVRSDDDGKMYKEWKMYDVSNGNVGISFRFLEDDIDFYSFNVTWDTNGHYIVFAMAEKNKFRICEVDENQIIANDVTYEVKKNENDDEKIFYDAVACCDDCFYLLSQKVQNKNEKDMKSESEIEVFDYSGKIQKIIKLKGRYLKMAIDSRTKQLFLFSQDNHIARIK